MTKSSNLVSDQQYIYSPAIYIINRLQYISFQNLSLNSQTLPSGPQTPR